MWAPSGETSRLTQVAWVTVKLPELGRAPALMFHASGGANGSRSVAGAGTSAVADAGHQIAPRNVALTVNN